MAKTGRNELCPCGSGKKFKKCHEAKEAGRGRANLMMLVIAGAMLAAVVMGIISLATTDSSPSGVRIWSPEHGHYHNEFGQQVP